MIYTAIDSFYLTEEQIKDSPSRKDGIDEATETTLRTYGFDLIQENSGCASSVWLASKLEEIPRRAREVIVVFHRMECRREGLPIGHVNLFSKKFSDLKVELNRTERHISREMGFVCHVEHPHKFLSNYLAVAIPDAPQELRQEAWNLANDRVRSWLVCGVVFAAAHRFQVPLPENLPWWKVFDAEKSGIDEVCKVLAHYTAFPRHSIFQSVSMEVHLHCPANLRIHNLSQLLWKFCKADCKLITMSLFQMKLQLPLMILRRGMMSPGACPLTERQEKRLRRDLSLITGER